MSMSTEEEPLRRSYAFPHLNYQQQEKIQLEMKELKSKYEACQQELHKLKEEKKKEKNKDDAMFNILHPEHRSNSGSSLLGAVQLLREYKKKGDPYNLDKPHFEEDDRSLLNEILYFCHMKDDEDHLRLLREVLNYSELKQYWDNEDECYHGPICWIQYHDENLALKLLPYFKSRDYRIDIRGILPDKILKEWDKLHASNVEPSKKKRKVSVEGAEAMREAKRPKTAAEISEEHLV